MLPSLYSQIFSTYDKTVGMGYRIDLVFNMIRVGLFFLDHTLINQNITKAKELMEQGGDWERKNRLRSYEALYKMSVRDFAGAATLYLEAVPTFGSYELMTYENLVFYTVVTSLFGQLRFFLTRLYSLSFCAVQLLTVRIFAPRSSNVTRSKNRWLLHS
ncbi:unnamed protein product [Strongylus vulgaris]|uniref:26S proteasome regulatory subunit Rpn7 N-terminal domain-containing protein n=1 Tax=Strongylus vulgaris TaxID=40348 RepID=A0A3P7KU10_STRVU|nr:unnamed protein product [Strongylus vulgaris]